MMKLSKMPPDVLIYIQSIKKYFSTDPYAQKYFAIEGNEQIFFDKITKISQENYQNHGEPELTIEQFEELRQYLSDIPGADIRIIASFMSIGDIGHISLN